MNLKGIIDLNIKHKTIQLLEKKNRKKLWHLELGKEFLDLTLKIQSIESNIY